MLHLFLNFEHLGSRLFHKFLNSGINFITLLEHLHAQILLLSIGSGHLLDSWKHLFEEFASGGTDLSDKIRLGLSECVLCECGCQVLEIRDQSGLLNYLYVLLDYRVALSFNSSIKPTDFILLSLKLFI